MTGVGGDDPNSWYAAHDSSGVLQELMSDLEQMCVEQLQAPRAAAGRRMESFRHRVFLDRERLLAVLDLAGSATAFLWDDVPFEVGLDFRFRMIRPGRLTCRLSVSVWSHTPWSTHHRPEGDEHRGPGGPLDTRRYQKVFADVQRATEAWISGCGFTEVTLRVFGRPYRAPVLWVAIPAGAAYTPVDAYLDGDHCPDVSGLIEPILAANDVRDRGVACAVLNGEVVALRRFVPGRSEDVPHYLLLPAAPLGTPMGWARRCRDRGLADRMAEQEDRIRHMVTTLTDLEIDAAGELWDIQNDLEIWENHLTLYDDVVERGSAHWDGMAGHLLRHRGRALGRVHHSIELIHQTLLQGAADIDRVSNLVKEHQSRLTGEAQSLQSRFDAVFTERPRADSSGLCRSLTEDGRFAEVARRASDIRATADRVARNCRDLLQAISHAFDERRARETDVLQRTTFAVGLFLGLVGLVTVADTTMNPKLDLANPSSVETGVRLGVWGLGALLLVALLRGWWQWMWLGRLGSRRYRATYRAVWDVLRFCSTTHITTVARRLDPKHDPARSDRPVALEQLCARAEQRREESARAWDEIDKSLACRFADAWDRVSRLSGDIRLAAAEQAPVRTRDGGPMTDAGTALVRWVALTGWRTARRDRKQLSRMIEKWSLRTFMLTERPLEMHQASLSRLTILYRCAMQMLDRDELRVVSDMDFFSVFANPDHAFTWDEVKRLDGWLDGEVRRLCIPSDDPGKRGSVRARELLARVDELGVQPGMAKDKERVLRVIGDPAPVLDRAEPSAR